MVAALEFVAEPLGREFDEPTLGRRQRLRSGIVVGETDRSGAVARRDLTANVGVEPPPLVRSLVAPALCRGVRENERLHRLDRLPAVGLRQRRRLPRSDPVVRRRVDDLELIRLGIDAGDEPDLEAEPFAAEFEQLGDFLLERPLRVSGDLVELAQRPVALPKLALDGLAVGDVPEVDREPRLGGVDADLEPGRKRRHVRLERRRLLALHRGSKLRLERLVDVRKHRPERVAQQLPVLEPDQLRRAVVDMSERPVGVEADHRVRDPTVDLLELRLESPTFDHVPDDTDHPAVRRRREAVLFEKSGAVVPQSDRFARPDASRRELREHLAVDPADHPRRVDLLPVHPPHLRGLVVVEFGVRLVDVRELAAGLENADPLPRGLDRPEDAIGLLPTRRVRVRLRSARVRVERGLEDVGDPVEEGEVGLFERPGFGSVGLENPPCLAVGVDADPDAASRLALGGRVDVARPVILDDHGGLLEYRSDPALGRRGNRSGLAPRRVSPDVAADRRAAPPRKPLEDRQRSSVDHGGDGARRLPQDRLEVVVREGTLCEIGDRLVPTRVGGRRFVPPTSCWRHLTSNTIAVMINSLQFSTIYHV